MVVLAEAGRDTGRRERPRVEAFDEEAAVVGKRTQLYGQHSVNPFALYVHVLLDDCWAVTRGWRHRERGNCACSRRHCRK